MCGWGLCDLVGERGGEKDWEGVGETWRERGESGREDRAEGKRGKINHSS